MDIQKNRQVIKDYTLSENYRDFLLSLKHEDMLLELGASDPDNLLSLMDLR